MLRILFLIFFLCGFTVLSVFLEYRASAEVSHECPSDRVCVPKPRPRACEVLPPSRRSCERAWQEHIIGNAIRSPQPMCFVFSRDKLQTVARVLTLDIMRAIGR